MTDVVAEVRTSDLEEIVADEVLAVAEVVTVAPVLEKEVTKVLADRKEIATKVKMKTAGIKIQAIDQGLHTEIRIDYKLKDIG